MNSRERILAAIDHKEPDKIPVDLGATPSSGISAIAYSNLKKHLGIKDGHTRIYDVVQQLALPEENILDRFSIDVLDVGRMFNSEESNWYDITMPNGNPAQYPKWFRPVKKKMAPGIFLRKMVRQSLKCRKAPHFLIKLVSPIWKVIQTILEIFRMRWRKFCGQPCH